MGFLRAVVSAYANLLNFGGRATRAEYWYYYLFIVLLSIAAGVVAVFAMTPERLLAFEAQMTRPAFAIGSFLAFTLPGWSLLIRRLHDIDRSGFWWLIAFVPVIGALVLLVFMVLPGTDGANRFGPPSGPGARRTKAPTQHPGSLAEEERKAEVHALYLARVRQQNA